MTKKYQNRIFAKTEILWANQKFCKPRKYIFLFFQLLKPWNSTFHNTKILHKRHLPFINEVSDAVPNQITSLWHTDIDNWIVLSCFFSSSPGSEAWSWVNIKNGQNNWWLHPEPDAHGRNYRRTGLLWAGQSVTDAGHGVFTHDWCVGT